MDSAHSLQNTLNPIIFAPMEIELEINSANDYANDIGAPTYHPHVSVIFAYKTIFARS